MTSRDAAESPGSNVDRRIVSVLFADVVGFTPLSERLDPEDVATIQDAYFSATRETIQRHGGVVEKFIGDAVMAVFGAPRARDDDAERAVHAGLALLAAIEQIGARLGMEVGALQLRVGVNTGEVVHATTGPDAGRVTGDTVNTAARLQTAARPGSVLIGELTALTVAEAIETTALGPVELKGKQGRVPVWEAIGIREHASREAALAGLRAPMLGRDAELAELLRALAGVVERRSAGRMVIVAPPGVGKSRLLAEFSAVARSNVIRARVRPQGTAPYETVAQLFASAAGDLASCLAGAGVRPARAAVIQDEVAKLVEPAALDDAPVGDVAVERDARFEAWVTALDALAGASSAWLVEDVHWAGGDLLAFLAFAADAPSLHGRLVVTTARPSLLASAPDWCAAAGRIDLLPLQVDDAAALIGALVGDALPDELARAVVERSDGTPLFIEELLRTWAGIGILVNDESGWRLVARPDAVPLPQTVQAIYAAQLDDLPPDARLVARRGAVAGRRLPVGALASLDLGEQRAGLEALRRRAFLTGPAEDPITGEGYAYRHALLRDAGYASLARAERAHLHLAMAGWLTAVAGERADVVAEAIAEHYANAVDSLPTLAPDLPERGALAAQAAAWFERGADAALRLSAVDAAQRLLRRSLELSGQDPPRDVARRRLRLGEVLASSAELDLGIDEIEAAREAFAADSGTLVEYERATYALGLAYMQQIRFPEATALTAAGIAHLGDARSDGSTSRLHALHAWSLAANGQPDGAAAEANAALAAARDRGDPAWELDVMTHWCAARDELDLAGDDDWELLEQRALALGRWAQVALASRVRAMLRAFTDPRGALPLFEASIEIAAAHGLTEQAGWGEYGRCETLWVLGDVDGAVAAGARVLTIAERNAYERLAFRTYMILLPIAAIRGDTATAARWDRWWAEAESHFPPNPSPYGRMLRGAYLVWLAQAAGHPAPIPPEDLVEAAIPMINPHFLAAIETVTRTWLDEGLREPAGRLQAAVAANVAGQADASPLMHASAALIEAWVSGSSDAANRSAELAASVPAPWWVERARAAAG